jgi:hypothetical protein
MGHIYLTHFEIMPAGFDPTACYQDCYGPGAIVAEDNFNDRSEVSDYWAQDHSGDYQLLGSSADGLLHWGTAADVSGYGGLEPVRVTVGIETGDTKQVFVELPSTAMLPARASFSANGAENLMSADFSVSMRFFYGNPRTPMGGFSFVGGDTGVYWGTGDSGPYNYGYHASIGYANGDQPVMAIQGPGLDLMENIWFPTGSWGILTWVNRPSINYGKISYVVDGTEYSLEVTFPTVGNIPDSLSMQAAYGSDGLSDGGLGWAFKWDDFKIETWDGCVDVMPSVPGNAPSGVVYSQSHGKTCNTMTSLGGLVYGVTGAAYRPGTSSVWVGGRLKRISADYSESSPETGEITFNAPVSGTVWMCYTEMP